MALLIEDLRLMIGALKNHKSEIINLKFAMLLRQIFKRLHRRLFALGFLERPPTLREGFVLLRCEGVGRLPRHLARIGQDPTVVECEKSVQLLFPVGHKHLLATSRLIVRMARISRMRSSNSSK